MKKVICIALAVTLLFCSACSRDNQAEFQTVLDDANTLHEAPADMTVAESIHDYMPEMSGGAGFTEDELASLIQNVNCIASDKMTITIEQATQDVDLLFRVLRYCYGPYEYLGGDQVFEKAKTSILADLDALNNPLKIGELTAVLQKRLSFMKDDHFLMNGNHLIEMNSYFTTEEVIFACDESGYYTMRDGTKTYVQSVSGDTDVESYMKLSISPEGKLVYYVGILFPQTAEEIPLSVVFESDTMTLTLRKVILQLNYDLYQAYSEDWDSDVPVVACRYYLYAGGCI